MNENYNNRFWNFNKIDGYALVAPINLIQLGKLIDIGRGCLTIDELATAANISSGVLANIFNGQRERHVSAETLNRIYEAFPVKNRFTKEQFFAANGMLIGEFYKKAKLMHSAVLSSVEQMGCAKKRTYVKKKCWAKRPEEKLAPSYPPVYVSDDDQEAMKQVQETHSYDSFICALSAFALPYADSDQEFLKAMCANTKKIYDIPELRSLVIRFANQEAQEKTDAVSSRKHSCLTGQETTYMKSGSGYRVLVENKLRALLA